MSSSLDASLEEIIRNKSRSEGNSSDSRRKTGGSGPGPDRRDHTRDPLRSNSYPIRPQMQEGQLVSSGRSGIKERVVGRGWVRCGGNGSKTAGAGGGFARGCRRGGWIGKKLSAEDLDAELDKYHLEATRIK
ncbi:THO complex subunit 4C-like [Durio zibethinus]|uniref:THO complex subunit 4C-like n=1 Tax=Durio zibethinus TaxID=66656 RepID=A0A6P5YY55_DURZI|nr:THO complex subunit 4C-like [Durio zibethinus]